ncbi:MAG: 6-carboxytetrahydropterin synthase QueD [Kiritimatiellae bacterium]|nr:6-carboxytetrahydropterin synthase QueD [Kiritimatiellia bacterium]MDD5520764.1 6-carboxytetrahydropterin synthase QueD [Kiritimatiellia bacterium]
MKVYELSVKMHFSAAHHLEGYNGKCAEQHGHNWEVEVFVTGNKLNNMGILIDFRLLKEMIREVLGGLDHADLNLLDPFRNTNPTSENIARFVFDELSVKMKNTGCEVSRVLIRETPETSASYTSRQ